MKRFIRILLLVLTVILIFSFASVVCATSKTNPGISVNINGANKAGTADSLQILFLLTVLALAPSLLIMMTGFTRIIIVLSFVRNALGLQQTPPNQVMVGIALFLTLFLMSPIVKQIDKEAYTPYSKGEITQKQAVDKALVPMRKFMLKQTNKDDLNLFISLGKLAKPKNLDSIPTEVVIPAFITSELRRAFIIGFIIYLPFLVIDMIVASVLMSMGMVMLPPVMISLPFKLLLFVLVDGWGLLIKTLIMSFN